MCKWQRTCSFPGQRAPLLFVLWKLSLRQLLVIIHVSLNVLILGQWSTLFFHSFFSFWGEFYNKNYNPSPRIKKAQTQDNMSSLLGDLRLHMGLIKTPSDAPWYSSLVKACFYSFMLTYALMHE